MAKRRRTASGATSGDLSFTPPYSPSWFDRLTNAIDRLPGSAWVAYVVLAVLLGGGITALAWIRGDYPAPTLRAGDIFAGAGLVYLLALMHYLDKASATALKSIRLLLRSEDPPSRTDHDPFPSLLYQLTTLPAAPAMRVTLAGAILGAIQRALRSPSSQPSPLFIAAFVAGNAVFFLLVYHTFHQLAQVGRIYTRHARINAYHPQSLYALSLPGALTALGLLFFTYVLFIGAPRSPIDIYAYVIIVAIALTIFALPPLGAHRRLVREREARLAEIASQFETAASEVHRRLDTGRLLQMDHLNKAVATLEIEYNFLRKVPTWPWEPGAIRAVAAAVLLPLVVWLLQVLLARLLGV